MSNSESADDYKRVLFALSWDYRLAICNGGIQWLLQRRVKDSDRWQSIGFFRSKEGLLFRLFSKSRPIEINHEALSLLSTLPDCVE